MMKQKLPTYQILLYSYTRAVNVVHNIVLLQSQWGDLWELFLAALFNFHHWTLFHSPVGLRVRRRSVRVTRPCPAAAAMRSTTWRWLEPSTISPSTPMISSPVVTLPSWSAAPPGTMWPMDTCRTFGLENDAGTPHHTHNFPLFKNSWITEFIKIIKNVVDLPVSLPQYLQLSWSQSLSPASSGSLWTLWSPGCHWSRRLAVVGWHCNGRQGTCGVCVWGGKGEPTWTTASSSVSH